MTMNVARYRFLTDMAKSRTETETPCDVSDMAALVIYKHLGIWMNEII